MTCAAFALLFLVGSFPALAETLACDLRAECDGVSPCTAAAFELRFAIDRNQFAPAIDPAEPPRRKLTRVTMGENSFDAEPILLDSGTRGFWTDDPATGEQVLTIAPDSSAIYTAKDGSGWIGSCREIG